MKSVLMQSRDDGSQQESSPHWLEILMIIFIFSCDLLLGDSYWMNVSHLNAKWLEDRYVLAMEILSSIVA